MILRLVALLLKLLDDALLIVLAELLVLPLNTPLLLLVLLDPELDVMLFNTTLVPIWLERMSSSA